MTTNTNTQTHIQIIDILDEDECVIVQCVINEVYKDVNIGEKEAIAASLGLEIEHEPEIFDFEGYSRGHAEGVFIDGVFVDEWMPSNAEAIKIIKKITNNDRAGRN